MVTRLDNGFSFDYDSGLPRLSGRAQFRAAPTLYRIEYGLRLSAELERQLHDRG